VVTDSALTSDVRNALEERGVSVLIADPDAG
jgi:hypothetical protein